MLHNKCYIIPLPKCSVANLCIFETKFSTTVASGSVCTDCMTVWIRITVWIASLSGCSCRMDTEERVNLEANIDPVYSFVSDLLPKCSLDYVHIWIKLCSSAWLKFHCASTKCSRHKFTHFVTTFLIILTAGVSVNIIVLTRNFSKLPSIE